MQVRWRWLRVACASVNTCGWDAVKRKPEVARNRHFWPTRLKQWWLRFTWMADWVPPARSCEGSCLSRRLKSAASVSRSPIENPRCRNSCRDRGVHLRNIAWLEKAAQTTRKSFRSKFGLRSEEHTSELQSHSDLVCRLLLEKKKTK